MGFQRVQGNGYYKNILDGFQIGDRDKGRSPLADSVPRYLEWARLCEAEIQMELPALGFILIQPQPLQSLGELWMK